MELSLSSRGSSLTQMEDDLLSVTSNDVSSTTHPVEDRSRNITGRLPCCIYLSCDHDVLSPYQVLVRKQIEFYEALECDIRAMSQGRNKPVVLGQVGIRCMHCRMLQTRDRGAAYYPTTLDSIYQAAQNMATIHLHETCTVISSEIRQELSILKAERKSSAGKKTWAERAQVLGVLEDEEGLRFRRLY